ncbi:MAG: hypothetical protein AAFY71_14835 [Bacteroidota bacterium]
MELIIRPSKKNRFPIGGFLIRGSSAGKWVLELQELGFSLDEVEVYALPGQRLNSVWGCFVLCLRDLESERLSHQEACQQVHPNFYIPEKADILPLPSYQDCERLFGQKVHIMHPEIGLVELEAPFDWAAHIALPKQLEFDGKAAIEGTSVPTELYSFEVVRPQTDILKQMEEDIMGGDRKEEGPLDLWEKGRLAFYKGLFSKEGEGVEKSALMKFFESFGEDQKWSQQWSQQMVEDFEELMKRNQKELDRLMDLLKNDPKEGLKYALPLDEGMGGRGSSAPGYFSLSRQWNNFNLFGNRQIDYSGSGGSAPLGNDGYWRLQNQYGETARQLKAEGEYKEAAFVYLKLLKNYRLAAATLEEGKYYAEAAQVYLKHCNDKSRAASCYEEGHMYREAIDLYKELEHPEKVGDLFMKLKERDAAMNYYQRAAEVHEEKSRYLAAARLYEEKMEDSDQSKASLLLGWERGHQAYECMDHYLDYYRGEENFQEELDKVYEGSVAYSNCDTFLRIVESEYEKGGDLQPHLKNMGYEIISKYASLKPSLAEQLRKFKKGDKELSKDLFRFRSKK